MRPVTGIIAFSLTIAGALLCAEGYRAQAQISPPALTDKFASTILQGGCSVQLPTGTSLRTEGTGGRCPTTVTAMMEHLRALNPQGTRQFVVSEDEDRPSGSKHYRFVVSFRDRPDARDGDIFLSLGGSPQGINEGFIEAMGFDSVRKAYVYYELERGVWKQAGSGDAVPLDTTPGNRDAMNCQACHSTGAPLMKELRDSWANWHSSWDGLSPPAGADPKFEQFFTSARADFLEPMIMSGTKESAIGRVDRAVAAKQAGLMLKQAMCEVGEPNLVGVHEKSDVRFGNIVTKTSMLPSVILLNQIFAAPPTGGGGVSKGFEGNLQMNLPDLGQAKSVGAAYAAAAKKLRITIDGMPGLNDMKFAWYGPEKGYADLAVAMELLARGLIDKDVLADVMMVDFTTPVFSKVRCDLAATIPANFTNAEDLRTAWIAALAKSTLRGAAGLKSRLEKKDDFAAHESKITTYLKACTGRGNAQPEKFNEDMLTVLSQRRNEFRRQYKIVLENDMMMPTDQGGAATEPGKWRLSAATCELEEQSARFEGE